MFAAMFYGLVFFAIVAVNHRYAKPWDEVNQARRERKARRAARYDKNRAAEKKEYEERRRKRHEAKRQKRESERRRAELRGF